MRRARPAQRLGQVLTWVVLLTSGAYVLVYLYRWQWNRALVAGVFFLAAELALAAGTVLRRLTRLEERLDSQARVDPAQDPAVLERVREGRPPPRRTFAWLDPTNGTHVFVPVLLGAGAVLSILAQGLERLASATARPVMESRLAARLGPLALPAGGLQGPGAGLGPGDLDDAAPLPVARRGWPARVVLALGTIVAVLAVTAGIDVVADATQNRPDAATTGLASELTLSVSHREPGPSATATTERLWSACRATRAEPASARQVVDLGAGRVRLVIEPALGEHGLRRFRGCIEDTTFERVQAQVLDVTVVPVGAG